jgi:predicted class III extradiol MEMO1 family dioxygenase
MKWWMSMKLKIPMKKKCPGSLNRAHSGEMKNMTKKRLNFCNLTGGLLIVLSLVGLLVYRWQPTAVLGEQTMIVPSTPAVPAPKLVAGVVPHHEVGAALAQDWWRQAATTGATKVLVIGPQHHLNPAPVVASDNFPALAGVYHDDQLLAADHAFTNQLIWAKEYLPQAEIWGLLLSSQIKIDDLRALEKALAPIIEAQEVLLLGSIDFSHDQSLPRMAKRDQEMRTWLESSDPVSSLLGVDDAYTDSWAGLVLILELMARQNLRPQIIAQSSSAEILAESDLQTATSYFYLQFTSE